MTAQEITAAWWAQTPEEQFNFCQNCVKKSIREGRRLKPGNEFDDAVQSTFEAVLTRLADEAALEVDCAERAQKGKPDTLAALICRCANATLQRADYDFQKHSKAIGRTITDQNGNELDMLESIASTSDTEDTAIIHTELRQFSKSLDAKDRIILDGMIAGQTERAMAPGLGISSVAVHYRIVRIRKELAAILRRT